MQSVLQRAEKALADLDSLFITKKQIRNLLTRQKGEKEMPNKNSKIKKVQK